MAEKGQIKTAAAVIREAIHKTEPILEKLHKDAEAHGHAHEITAMSASLSRKAIVTGVITLLVGMILSFFISRSITDSINKTADWLTAGAETSKIIKVIDEIDFQTNFLVGF